MNSRKVWLLLYWWIDGYLATVHELERYHGDLDLFINEKNLITLKELVDNSEDFKFVENQDVNEELLVDECHFSPEYTEMCFPNQAREHNGSTYRMMSLESIYNAKKIQDLRIDMTHL